MERVMRITPYIVGDDWMADLVIEYQKDGMVISSEKHVMTSYEFDSLKEAVNIADASDL